MTIKTWKEEFYPKPPRKSMTKRQAIEHSLRKWEGLTSASLKKHGLTKLGAEIYGEDNEFKINLKSCALCVKYYDSDAISLRDLCRKCPFRTVLGRDCDFGTASPYDVWYVTGNPRPMIKALRKLLEA